MNTKPEPITAAQLPEDWIEERREVIAREAFAIRACSFSLNIEIQSQRSGEWLILSLPDKAPAFATVVDRDAVLASLWRTEPIAKKEVAP